MAANHQDILQKGRDAIAEWVTDNPGVPFTVNGVADVPEDLNLSDLIADRWQMTTCVFRRTNFSSGELSQHLTSVDFTGSVFEGSNFEGVVLNGCNLTHAKLDAETKPPSLVNGGAWDSVKFGRGGRSPKSMMGVSMISASLRHVIFTDTFWDGTDLTNSGTSAIRRILDHLR